MERQLTSLDYSFICSGSLACMAATFLGFTPENYHAYFKFLKIFLLQHLNTICEDHQDFLSILLAQYEDYYYYFENATPFG